MKTMSSKKLILFSIIPVLVRVAACSDTPEKLLFSGHYDPRLFCDSYGNYYIGFSGSDCFVECHSGSYLYKITGSSIVQLSSLHFIGQQGGQYSINDRGNFLHLRDQCRLFATDGSSHGVSCRSFYGEGQTTIEYHSASLGGNGLHVVTGYSEGETSGSSFFQLFNWDGDSLGPRIRFPHIAGRYSVFPTMSLNGRFLLNWKYALPDSHSVLLGQCFNANGQPASPVFVVNSTGPTQQVAFAAQTLDDACNSTFIWAAWGTIADGNRGMWISRFDASGQLRSAIGRMQHTTGHEAVSLNQHDEISLAWCAADPAHPDQPKNYAWFRKFRIDGTPRTGPIRVSDQVAASTAAVQVDPQGRSLVVWSTIADRRQADFSSNDLVIYGQLFDKDGNKISLESLDGLPADD